MTKLAQIWQNDVDRKEKFERNRRHDDETVDFDAASADAAAGHRTGVSGDGNAVGEFRMYKRKPLVYDKIVRKGLELKDMFN